MICIVDFDGTYLRNDLFKEVFIRAILFRPIYFLQVLFTSGFRIIRIKNLLLKNYFIYYDLSILENQVLLDWLIFNRSRFNKVYLVSATPDFFLKRILKGSILFDNIYGSKNVNLKGKNKLNFIRKKWGEKFIYVGDSSADIPIFNFATEAYKVVKNEVIKL